MQEKSNKKITTTTGMPQKVKTTTTMMAMMMITRIKTTMTMATMTKTTMMTTTTTKAIRVVRRPRRLARAQAPATMITTTRIRIALRQASTTFQPICSRKPSVVSAASCFTLHSLSTCSLPLWWCATIISWLRWRSSARYEKFRKRFLFKF